MFDFDYLGPDGIKRSTLVMPFGKYKGRPLGEIPTRYLDDLTHSIDESWFKRRLIEYLDSRERLEDFHQVYAFEDYFKYKEPMSDAERLRVATEKVWDFNSRRADGRIRGDAEEAAAALKLIDELFKLLSLWSL